MGGECIWRRKRVERSRSKIKEQRKKESNPRKEGNKVEG